jgi:hypothetical protein
MFWPDERDRLLLVGAPMIRPKIGQKVQIQCMVVPALNARTLNTHKAFHGWLDASWLGQ